MQALGMTTLPPNNQYSVKIDDSERTYTLSWPATTPNGMSVVKQIVFDGDAATGTKPQVKKHLILDTKGKLICSAEIKRAQTVTLSPTGQPVLTGREPAGTPRPGDQTPAPVAVQHPTLMVLRWEEQKFEMELELKTGKVNDTLTEEQMRRLFTCRTSPAPHPSIWPAGRSCRSDTPANGRCQPAGTSTFHRPADTGRSPLSPEHSHLLRVGEQPAGFEDGCHFAQRQQRRTCRRWSCCQRARGHVDDELVAGADPVDQPSLLSSGTSSRR